MNDPETQHEPESIEPGQPPYALDVSTLTKGTDITEAECARHIGIKPSDKRWPFAMMMFASWIMYESETRGAPLSVCQRKGGIHINTDAEAAVYHERHASRHEDGIKRQYRHMCTTVNTASLNEIQRAEHEQNVKVWALKLAALKNHRQLAPAPVNPLIK
jgi:hypothetical protein